MPTILRRFFGRSGDLTIFRMLLLASICFLVPGRGTAQQGHWKTNVLCTDCEPQSLIYGDSLHFFVIVDNGYGIVHHTEDGGRTWDTSRYFRRSFFPSSYTSASFIPPETYFLFDVASLTVSTDNGETWTMRAIVAGSGVQAGKMFTLDSGYRVHSNPPKVELRSTFSGGLIFVDRISEWPNEQNHTIILDTDRIIRAHRKFYRSYNRGSDWETIYPLDTSGGWIDFHLIQLSPDSSRFYLVGGYDTSEFVRTTDAGKTWDHFHGEAAKRVMRIAEQTPADLWMLVDRQKAAPTRNLLARGLYFGNFSDTLYYSSDSGKTWIKDLTFVGDTITELMFPSPTQGFVVSLRDKAVKFSRWVSDPAAVRGRGLERSQLFVHPNPASDRIKFVPPLSGVVLLRVLDMFGRTIHSEATQVQESQSHTLSLPESITPGCYTLDLQFERGRSVHRFVVAR